MGHSAGTTHLSTLDPLAILYPRSVARAMAHSQPPRLDRHNLENTFDDPARTMPIGSPTRCVYSADNTLFIGTNCGWVSTTQRALQQHVRAIEVPFYSSSRQPLNVTTGHPA